MQPIHFTRGYIWGGLFLLSLPGLLWLINYLQKSKFKQWGVACLVLILLSDNILWTTNVLRKKETIEWEGHISEETENVLTFLKRAGTTNDLLIGNAALVNYLANVYTPANSWASHPFNTPNREKRIKIMENFMQNGILPEEWKDRRVLLIINKKNAPLGVHPSLQLNKVFENDTYSIFTL